MKITPEMSDVLTMFVLKRSKDGVKEELELMCGYCNGHICDAEEMDSLLVLVETAERHRRDCQKEKT